MQAYTKTEINNGISNVKMGMPMKDLTSDNNATFEMNRILFQKAYIPPNNFAIRQQGKSVIERESLGLSNNQVVIDGPKTFYQKKWIGGNRDASQVAKNRRVNATGAVMANVNNRPTSFKDISDTNTAREALRRVRGGGAANVPQISAKHYPNKFGVFNY
jgi:hypothetical protein